MLVIKAEFTVRGLADNDVWVYEDEFRYGTTLTWLSRVSVPLCIKEGNPSESGVTIIAQLVELMSQSASELWPPSGSARPFRDE